MKKNDRFSGQPRLSLTASGADLTYIAGQPVMDQGMENPIMISLFTRRGWAGNVFLPRARQIGSDYEKTSEGAITLQKLADIENAAELALKSDLFGTVRAEAANPTADSLVVDVHIGSGAALSLTRERALWTAQISDPASRKG